MTEEITNKLPRKEDPALRRNILERIVASYISGIHHEDVIADDVDILFAEKILNSIDAWLDAFIEGRNND